MRAVARAFAVLSMIALAQPSIVIATTASQTPSKPARLTLIGLDAAAVVARIGEPDQKDELADSDEAYWIYKTKAGVLTVHFQNHVVITYSPEDFPLEKIWKK